MTARRLDLIPRNILVQTGSIDHAQWNYGGVLGYVSRQRFQLVTALLPAQRLERILEIGYGSGVFIPELAKRAQSVSGVDVHGRSASVTASLARLGIVADLRQASAESLPYAQSTFDAIVAVSSLEFVGDIPAALREMTRVLKPNGRAIIVTPGDHPVLDLALRAATGADARRDFGNKRSAVLAAVATQMRVVKAVQFPRWSPIPIYRAFVLEPLPAGKAEGESREPYGKGASPGM